MGKFSALAFCYWLALSPCFAKFVLPLNNRSQLALSTVKEYCAEYKSYEVCVKEANVLVEKCRRDSKNSQSIDVKQICDHLEEKLENICSDNNAKVSCLACYDKTEKEVESCTRFPKMINCDLNTTVTRCEELKASLIKHCKSEGCQGKCTGKPCENGGTCIGENLCKCPPAYSGPQCTVRKRLGTRENPAPNAQAILDAGDSHGSGMYWIQPPGETAPAQTYCDMTFAGGAWMLASYGYVHATSINAKNKAIPNMNNPNGYAWLPTQRSSSNGLINLPHGAVKMANKARSMIMAAGNNPATGGIDQYSYVYRINITDNPYTITFANHNRFNGGQPGRMHVQDFIVEALKGESGTYVRHALGEALGVTWSDSYPTGYGFNDKTGYFSVFNKGPFFPSVHSGSGRSLCSSCTPTNYEPDVKGGSPHYTHHGWYTATSYDKTGQTSIWFN